MGCEKGSVEKREGGSQPGARVRLPAKWIIVERIGTDAHQLTATVSLCNDIRVRVCVPLCVCETEEPRKKFIGNQRGGGETHWITRRRRFNSILPLPLTYTHPQGVRPSWGFLCETSSVVMIQIVFSLPRATHTVFCPRCPPTPSLCVGVQNESPMGWNGPNGMKRLSPFTLGATNGLSSSFFMFQRPFHSNSNLKHIHTDTHLRVASWANTIELQRKRN